MTVIIIDNDDDEDEASSKRKSSTRMFEFNSMMAKDAKISEAAYSLLLQNNSQDAAGYLI